VSAELRIGSAEASRSRNVKNSDSRWRKLGPVHNVTQVRNPSAGIFRRQQLAGEVAAVDCICRPVPEHHEPDLRAARELQTAHPAFEVCLTVSGTHGRVEATEDPQGVVAAEVRISADSRAAAPDWVECPEV
jgi:hypothetical protein